MFSARVCFGCNTHTYFKSFEPRVSFHDLALWAAHHQIHPWLLNSNLEVTTTHHHIKRFIGYFRFTHPKVSMLLEFCFQILFQIIWPHHNQIYYMLGTCCTFTLQYKLSRLPNFEQMTPEHQLSVCGCKGLGPSSKAQSWNLSTSHSTNWYVFKQHQY